MSGKTRLEGAMADKAKRHLRIITDELDKHGIRYCLDGGTLLGIAREGRILPWDDDLDLFIAGEDAEKLSKCHFALFRKGIRVSKDNVREDFGALKTGKLRMIKYTNRKRLIQRGPLVLDAIVKYADDEFYYWSVGKGPVVNKKVPRHFYDNLTTIHFDGKDYPAPTELDAYLTCRYGEWKIPVKTWDYRTDDQAISQG